MAASCCWVAHYLLVFTFYNQKEDLKNLPLSPVQPGPGKLSQTFMNRESNHEQCRVCSCVGPNASKHLTGALGWPAADKWITSCENNKLHTEAKKITAQKEWERKNQTFSIQVRFYTQGEPCYTVSADAFDCVCVCRGADRHTPLPTPSLLLETVTHRFHQGLWRRTEW